MTKPARVPEVLPPPEAYQHGDVVHEDADAKNAGPKRARRRHPLESLFYRVSPSISEAQYRAGMTFSADYEAAHRGQSAAQYDGIPIPEAYYGRMPGQAAMEASANVQAAVRALGKRLSGIAVAVCGEGTSLAQWASRRQMSAHQATGYLIAALDKLSEHYGG